MYRHIIYSADFGSAMYQGFSFTHSQLKNNLTKLFYFYGERDAISRDNVNVFALKINNSLIEFQCIMYNSLSLQNNFSG